MWDGESDVDRYSDHVLVPSRALRVPVGPVLAWEGSWQAEVSVIARQRATPAVRRALDLATRQGFVLTRPQARACGLSEAALRRLVRRGDWCACAIGALGVVRVPAADPGDVAGRADVDRRRHALVAAAGALRHPGHVVSGVSAAVLHGLPLLRVPRSAQLTAGAPATPGVRRGVLVRPASLEPDHVSDWFGAAVTTPARTIVDLGRHERASALMAVDAALREGLTSPRDIDRVVARCTGWPGIKRARAVLALASPLAESPLESLTRLALHDSGFPPPELQVVIGRYRVDLLWRERRLILEADGKIKYEHDELWREKRRELELTRLGYRVERVTWGDVRYRWADMADRLWVVLASPPPR